MPNHTSDEHAWFRAALAAAPGSPERARYLFRDGRGPDGAEPPNDWQSVFGGGAWQRVIEADGTPGQWYLHLFDVKQPDLDWTNPEVSAEFDGVLRFWLDRGVDGFRIDVAHGLVKADGLPDWTPPEGASGGASDSRFSRPPYWDQEGVHEVYRHWHRVAAEYEGDRLLCAEAWVEPAERLARYVRPDEPAPVVQLRLPDDGVGREGAARGGRHLRARDGRRRRAEHVGAEQPRRGAARHPLRLPGRRRACRTASVPTTRSRTPRSACAAPAPRRCSCSACPAARTSTRARSLGLPEHTTMPDDVRQDPTWLRSGHVHRGRDGCRVPVPWSGDAPSYGFNDGSASWLPQPEVWADLALDRQRGVDGSTYEPVPRGAAAAPRPGPGARFAGVDRRVRRRRRGVRQRGRAGARERRRRAGRACRPAPACWWPAPTSRAASCRPTPPSGRRLD
nr:alpha-amylase family glycosyl hydrolase [Angustibacter aerolatus]